MRQQKFIHVLLMVSILLSTWGLSEAQPRARSNAQAGVFDYYVLSLSWSPEFCADPQREDSALQCRGERPFGFVVHGLWPQYEHGYPEFCQRRAKIEAHIIQQLLPIMPSEDLIRHQWRKHGSCSGLTTQQYAEKITRVFALLTIPTQYKSPIQRVSTSVRDLKRAFVAANKHLTERSVAVRCQGRFLREVRVCLDKDLNARPCGTEVRDSCHSAQMILRPLR